MPNKAPPAVALKQPLLDKTPLPQRPTLLEKDQAPDTQPPSMPADVDDGSTGVTTAAHTSDVPPASARSAPPTKVEDVFRPRSLPGALETGSPPVAALRT